jgi:hypothetical protein
MRTCHSQNYLSTKWRYRKIEIATLRCLSITSIGTPITIVLVGVVTFFGYIGDVGIVASRHKVVATSIFIGRTACICTTKLSFTVPGISTVAICSGEIDRISNYTQVIMS